MFILVFLVVITLGHAAMAQETLRLSLYDALVRAIEHNESYLIAEAEETRAAARVGQARAEVLPNVRFFGDYTRNFEIPEQFVTIGDQTERFKFGFKHSTNWGFSATQSIYKGGRVFAAWAAARWSGWLI